jgi:large subunit ribosomal protein L16
LKKKNKIMLYPKKVKHKKWQKGTSKGQASRGTELAFGSYGLKSLGRSWISSRQIEAARRVIIRYLRKGGKLWIRIFPAKPVTFKGTEVPMGGGKGGVDHYVYPIKPGRIIFELDGVKEESAKEAFQKAAHKLPIKTKFVKR